MVLVASTSVIHRCHFIVLVHQSDIGSQARIAIVLVVLTIRSVLLFRLMALQHLVYRRQIAGRLIHLHQIILHQIFADVLAGGAVSAFIIRTRQVLVRVPARVINHL